MTERKKAIVQTMVIGFLLVLTLPLFYLLFSRVLLPWAWKEDAFREEQQQQEELSSLRSPSLNDNSVNTLTFG